MWRRSKYNAKKIHTEDGDFDSAHESRHWTDLKILQEEGKISHLERQKTIQLIPNQRMSDGSCLRGIKYVADFFYFDEISKIYVCEDAKPMKNGKVSESYKKTSAWKEYMIKKKLLLYTQGIEIREV